MKKSNILAFQRYKIFHSNSKNDKVMVKTKKVAERGDFFFVPKCIFTQCNIFFFIFIIFTIVFIFFTYFDFDFKLSFLIFIFIFINIFIINIQYIYIYIHPTKKKMLPVINTFFSFEHIFIIS